MEFQTGRQEAIQNLTRGIGLLEEAELSARRDAEQMGRALIEMREALAKVEATNEATWTKEGKFCRGIDARPDHHRKRAHGMERGAAEVHRALRRSAQRRPPKVSETGSVPSWSW